MPTATSFAALGRGNGFPFCATKKNVSGFTNWITLGGVSGGSASTSQINVSLVNAMKLWWNLNSITGSFSASGTQSVEGNFSVSATNHQLIIKRDGESDPLAPIQRTCRGTSSFTSGRDDELVTSFFEDDENDVVSADGSLSIGNFTSPGFIVRMYNGSTDNESNFVGYGVSRLAVVSAFAEVGQPATLADASITVGSYMSGTNSSGVDPGTGITFDLKVFQTTLGGIPFRSKTVANAAFSGSGTESLSTSQFSASATANSSITGPPSRSSSTNVSASLSSIDFYTY